MVKIRERIAVQLSDYQKLLHLTKREAILLQAVVQEYEVIDTKEWLFADKFMIYFPGRYILNPLIMSLKAQSYFEVILGNEKSHPARFNLTLDGVEVLNDKKIIRILDEETQNVDEENTLIDEKRESPEEYLEELDKQLEQAKEERAVL